MKAKRSRSVVPKATVRRLLQAADAENLLEAANDSCAYLETFGNWMGIAGQKNSADLIEAQLVANTGTLLNKEIRQLREVLAALHNQIVNASPTR